MRAVSVLVVLVVLVAWGVEAQSTAARLQMRCRDRSCVRSRLSDVSAGAFLEFAPASGAGMTAACACTAPSGIDSNGLPVSLTFARASDATCLKGGTLTNIAVGDMVTCSTDQPRVMYGGDGSGSLGLLRENARVNTCWRSESLDFGALWVATGTVSAAPTITANQGLSPTNTNTMDRVQAALTGATGVSAVIEAGACTASQTDSAGCFVRGTSGSGTTDLCIRTGAAAWSCQPCAFVSGSASRCKVEGAAVTANGDLVIGNASLYNGGTTRTASDFLAWGCHCEIGATLSSYIPATGSADGTRAAEYADLPAAMSGLSGFSMSASFIANGATYSAGGTAVPLVLGDGTLGSTTGPATYVWLYAPNAGGRGAVDTAGVASAGAATWDPFFASFASTSVSTAAFHTGAFLGACQEGVCGAAGANPGVASTLGTPTFTRLLLGRHSATAATGFNGVIKNVCLDRSDSRCLPLPVNGSTVWIGDSIIYGTGSTPQSPPRQLSALAGHNIVNAGVGSNTTAQCSSRWTTIYRERSYSTLIWSCAVNDVANGITGAVASANAIAVFQEARAQGMRVIVTGVMPWKNSAGWTSGKNDEGVAYNTAVQAWAADAGMSFVATTSMGGQGGDADVLLTTLNSGDAIHPNVAGAAAFATLVNAAAP